MKTKLILLAITGTLLTSVNALAASLNLIPASSSVELGSPVSMEVRIAGLGDGVGPSLGAYDLTFGFDPLVLSFSSFSFGDTVLGGQLDLGVFGSVTGTDGSVSGQLNVFEISLEATEDLNDFQASEFALGTIIFGTIGAGSSSVDVLSSIFADAEGGALSVEASAASVEVLPASNRVPETASSGILLALCSAGLLACSRMPRRKVEHGFTK